MAEAFGECAVQACSKRGLSEGDRAGADEAEPHVARVSGEERARGVPARCASPSRACSRIRWRTCSRRREAPHHGGATLGPAAGPRRCTRPWRHRPAAPGEARRRARQGARRRARRHHRTRQRRALPRVRRPSSRPFDRNRRHASSIPPPLHHARAHPAGHGLASQGDHGLSTSLVMDVSSQDVDVIERRSRSIARAGDPECCAIAGRAVEGVPPSDRSCHSSSISGLGIKTGPSPPPLDVAGPAALDETHHTRSPPRPRGSGGGQRRVCARDGRGACATGNPPRASSRRRSIARPRRTKSHHGCGGGADGSRERCTQGTENFAASPWRPLYDRASNPPRRRAR